MPKSLGKPTPPLMSNRRNLVQVRPPAESQRSLRREGEMNLCGESEDAQRRETLMRYFTRELQRILDQSQQPAGSPSGVACEAQESSQKSGVENDYFEVDGMIANRFRVVKKLHGGAFGQVFAAKDAELQEMPVAVKVEARSCPTPLLALESIVLKRVQGKTHVPLYVSAGKIEDKYNYLAMQLLGPSLDDLRRRNPSQVKRFSSCTCIMLLMQCLEAVHEMHSAGFLHRDIKGSNFTVGGSVDTRRLVYILDFGLAREHVDPNRPDWPRGIRAERKRASFRGTVRYASIAAHQEKDLGRRDDLWSLFYTVLEWFDGSLPWSSEPEADIVYRIKQSVSLETLCHNKPSELIIFAKCLSILQYADEPDYAMYFTLIRRMAEKKNVKFDEPFDWEENFRHAQCQ